MRARERWVGGWMGWGGGRGGGVLSVGKGRCDGAEARQSVLL
jgi:hypothetical protein